MTPGPTSPVATAIAISRAWGDYFPVNVRDVAQQMSSKQPDPIHRIETIQIRGVEGVLARNSGKWGIAYSSFIREQGKVNFTIAHELGHYFSHRAGKDQIICTNDDLNDFSEKGQMPSIEQEANDFASYLLMPIGDFRKQVDGQMITFDLLEHCRARYDVSLSAAALKLLSFTTRAMVIISSEAGKVRWSRSSQAALRMGVHFKKGASIPEQSQSFRCAGGNTSNNLTKGVLMPPSVWPNGGALESAVAQPNYGTVLTVLDLSTHSSKWSDEDELDRASDSYDKFKGSNR